MGVDIGIVGLAKSGKTTIFNALTGGQADIGSAESHVGVTKVPEPRLETLASILNPHRIVPTEIKYIDIGASVKGLVKEHGVSGRFLAELSNVDALINVARAFTDESIPHPEGSLDVERDIASMGLELAFSDLAIIERRLERIETSLKGAKQPERQVLLREQELLSKIKAELEKDIPVRELKLTHEEARTIATYQFLTAKPRLILVNIGEEQLSQAASLEAELNSRFSRPDCRVIALCGKLEMELSQLDSEAAAEFRADFGIEESGLDRAIKLSYELLGLVSFFTIASNEVKVWPVRKGTDALRAAGKIHSDMERGFIRAEVVSYDHLAECGSLAEAKKRGLLRLEGKNYTVQDGDVITFLFNV